MRVEKDTQARVRIEEVESNLTFDMIDLDGQDEEDIIPLREMITKARSSNLAPLPKSDSFVFY